MHAKKEKILLAAYTGFRDSGGEWPTYHQVESRLARTGLPNVDEVARLIRRIPTTMMVPLGNYPSHPDPREKVVLLVAGVARLESGRDDVANFIEAVRWLSARVRNSDLPTGGGTPRMPVTAAQLAAALGLPLTDPNPINRLMALLRAEGLVLPDGH